MSQTVKFCQDSNIVEDVVTSDELRVTLRSDTPDWFVRVKIEFSRATFKDSFKFFKSEFFESLSFVMNDTWIFICLAHTT